MERKANNELGEVQGMWERDQFNGEQLPWMREGDN
jgi:hypothetical protein